MHLLLLCSPFQGGDYEGGLTPAASRHLAYMGNCYCTFAHLCSSDLMKEIAPVEGTGQIPYYASYQPERVGHNSDSCIISTGTNNMPLSIWHV